MHASHKRLFSALWQNMAAISSDQRLRGYTRKPLYRNVSTLRNATYAYKTRGGRTRRRYTVSA